MKFVEFSEEDKRAFDLLLRTLLTLGDEEVKLASKAYHQFINRYFVQSPSTVSEEDWQLFYALFNQIRPKLDTLKKQQQTKDADSFDKTIVLFLLLNLALANNALVSTVLSSSGALFSQTSLVFAKQYNFLCIQVSKIIENAFLAIILADPYLRDLKKRISLIIQENSNQTHVINTNIEVILSIVERKNAASKKFGTQYNGQCVYVPGSDFMYTVDPDIIPLLISQLELIVNNQKSRTQFLVFLGAFAGHMLTLDASYNPQTKKLELICVDPARNYLQWLFLQLLTSSLKAKKISYELLACFANVQKDPVNCKVFSLAISTKIKNFSLAQLRAYAVLSTKLQIFFESPIDGKKPVLSQLPELTDVLWFPNQALGFDIIKMHQSMHDMEEDLLYLCLMSGKVKNQDDVSKVQAENKKRIAELMKLYEFDFKSKKSYIDYRIQSLSEKHNDAIYSGLTVGGILRKMDANTVEQGLWRFASGEGSKREMRFFLEHKDVASFIDKADQSKLGRTSLHCAFIENQVGRACLLLEKNARFDIRDKEGKTAVDYFNESKSTILKENQYIRQKLIR